MGKEDVSKEEIQIAEDCIREFGNCHMSREKMHRINKAV